ncbi:MAG: tyrosine-protein phosphatase [Deltaproteobacteria bacterium]|nr:tyrosine-protein phosphatase [Deltaproteobacteria bacterium]
MLNILNPRSTIRNPKSLPAFIVVVLLLLLGCATAPPQHPNRLELAGARNLRDLGGYSTIDGRQIKKGMLYRMDHPKRARERDVEAVVALGVKTVYDLRSEKELERDPPRLQAVTMLEVVHLPVDCELIDPYAVAKRILKGDVEEGDFQGLMLECYRNYVLNYTSEWSSLLRNMAKPGGLPGIIHCTYGRDRTGVSVAIILRSLGVPEETVLEDYLLSNTFWESETDRLSCFASCASCFRTPRSEVRALMEVRPEYLEAAFEAIDYKYGSFEGYLHEGLGIDDATLERLRSALLE